MFIAVILLEPTQFLFINRFGQPYPSLTMPRFTSTLTDENGTISFSVGEITAHFDDGTSGPLSIAQLVGTAPIYMRSGIVSTMFAARDERAEAWHLRDPESTSERLKDLLTPGRQVSRARLAQPEADPETTRWLEDRMEVVFPGRHVVRVTFDWYQESFPTDTPRRRVARERLGTFEVRLSDAR